jgi:hypothetical protein
MDADERAVYYYIRSLRPTAAPVHEISRRVGGKRKFHYRPEWVLPVLTRMVERGILLTDADGSYHLKPVPRDRIDGKRWVTLEIAEVLTASGKGFKGLITPEDEDLYYDQL